MTDTVTRNPYPTPAATTGLVPFEPQWRTASGHGPVPPGAVPPGDTGTVDRPGPPSRRWRRVAAGVVAIVLVAGGGTAGGVLADQLADRGTTASASQAGAGNVAAGITQTGSLAAVASAVSPSIVTVLVDGTSASGLGSGVVLSTDGLILTNNHVIASGGTVRVRLSDGRTVPATVAAADPVHDLALVRATGLTGLTPATFATDDSVAVGDTVLAFGSPLGLENTVTAGIVSAVDRRVDTGSESLTGLLQTDAPINAGNSGGALVDTSGRVIGINVAIATAGASTGSVGVGFAIPAGTVSTVVSTLSRDAT
jgi:putative serine protease PepD